MAVWTVLETDDSEVQLWFAGVVFETEGEAAEHVQALRKLAAQYNATEPEFPSAEWKDWERRGKALGEPEPRRHSKEYMDWMMAAPAAFANLRVVCVAE